MTRKDYIVIASAFSDTTPRPWASGAHWMTEEVHAALVRERRYIAGALAAKLREDNPRFDPDKFLVACGV